MMAHVGFQQRPRPSAQHRPRASILGGEMRSSGRGERSSASFWLREFPRGTGVAWLLDRAVEKTQRGRSNTYWSRSESSSSSGASELDLLRWPSGLGSLPTPAPHGPQPALSGPCLFPPCSLTD